MYSLTKRFDRDFGRLSEFGPLFGDFERWFRELDGSMYPRGESSVPRMTTTRTDNGYVIHTDLPGFSDNDVKLDVHNNVLTLSGERQLGNWEEHKASRRERSTLKFSSSLRLPEDVDTEKVGATLKDGVLTVTISHKPEVKPRQIQITGE